MLCWNTQTYCKTFLFESLNIYVDAHFKLQLNIIIQHYIYLWQNQRFCTGIGITYLGLIFKGRNGGWLCHLFWPMVSYHLGIIVLACLAQMFSPNCCVVFLWCTYMHKSWSLLSWLKPYLSGKHFKDNLSNSQILSYVHGLIAKARTRGQKTHVLGNNVIKS